MKKELGIIVLLVALCAVLAIFEPNSMGADNVYNMLKRISMYGIFAIGLGIVIITGGIDLSVGSVFALEGVLLCLMINTAGWPIWLGEILALAGLVVLGIFHGFLVTKMKLQPFIVTLCGLMIYRGAARTITSDKTAGLGDGYYGWLQEFASGRIRLTHGYQVPSAFFVLLGVTAIMYVVLHRSVYGRYLFAVGRNEEAARFSGINTRLVIGSAYVVSMVLAGITGIILVFDVRSVGPSNFGISYEMYGIAAAVLGGCSLQGGEGSIIGIILGTALIQVLLNLVNLIKIHGEPIPSTWEQIVMGVVILLGVLFDQFLKSRKKAVVVT